MRYCGEGRFSSRIITRSFSYKVPIDRCYNCCKYSLLQCCSRNAKIFVELIDIDRDLHFDFRKSFFGIGDQCIVNQEMIWSQRIQIEQRDEKSEIQIGFYLR